MFEKHFKYGNFTFAVYSPPEEDYCIVVTMAWDEHRVSGWQKLETTSFWELCKDVALNNAFLSLQGAEGALDYLEKQLREHTF